MRTTALAAALLIGCSSAPAADEPPVDAGAPNACNVPSFAPEECEVVHLDGVSGPLDHQTICRRGAERWVLNPDGDQWHMLDAADGGAPRVLCHGAPDGAVLWAEDGG